MSDTMPRYLRYCTAKDRKDRLIIDFEAGELDRDDIAMLCPRCLKQKRSSNLFARERCKKVSEYVPGAWLLAADDEPAIGGRYECSNGHRFEVWWDKETCPEEKIASG
jgi:hypothetical protein